MENAACQYLRGLCTTLRPPPPRGGTERSSGPSDALRHERLWSACKNRASCRLRKRACPVSSGERAHETGVT
jgi:hypothetical protein